MEKRRTTLAQLRWERERRGWSRDYVAARVEVDVATVGRWERGERVPQPYYRQKLCTLFEKNAQELGLLVDDSDEPDDLEAEQPPAINKRNDEQPPQRPPASPLASTPPLYATYSEKETPATTSQQPGTSEPLQASRQEHLSRRTLLVGLMSGIVGAGAGSAITWLAFSRKPAPPAPKLAVNHTLLLYRGYQAGVAGAVWSPDGRRIASGGAFERAVQMWDATTGKNIVRYRIHSPSVNAVALSPDGKYLASASGSFLGSGDDRTVQVWNVANGNSIVTYRKHTKEIRTVAWSPNNRYLVSAGDDGTVHVWNAATGETLYTYTGHALPVYAVAWSPDGERIASGGDDKVVRVWMAMTGEQKMTYLHSDLLRAVAWSPDGQHIASSGGFVDPTVQLWDATSGQQILVYRGHSEGVNTVAWSPDGKLIVSGSSDKTAQVWLAASGKQIFTYGEHTLGIMQVAWSPQQTLIASASADGTVRVWNMK